MTTAITCCQGLHVALFGLGGSGLSTAKALVAGGAHVTAWDDQPAKIEQATAAGIPTADLRHADWSRFALFVLTPGVPLTHPRPHWTVELAKAAGVEIIGDIELFVRERRAVAPGAPLVAITGTNGKSTTTALMAHLIAHSGRKVAMGGNIGTPVFDLAAPAADIVHVIECSSFQIDLAPTLDPSVGIMLNVTEDHLDRHGTMANYAGIKERLVAGVPKTGTAVVGVDDGYAQAMADRLEKAGLKVVRISVRRPLSAGMYANGPALMLADKGAAKRVATLAGIGALRGAHNAQNALAAFAAARALGLSEAEIQAGLMSFPGLAHRMEQVGRLGRVLFVNDSKATNADAAARALASFETIYWIAGGKPKTGGIVSLSDHFPKIVKAYLIGEAARSFGETLGPAVAHEVVGTLEAAVTAAARDAAADPAADPVVLLSPACASFDQFPNFEVRGDRFRALVHALPGIGPVNAKGPAAPPADGG